MKIKCIGKNALLYRKSKKFSFKLKTFVYEEIEVPIAFSILVDEMFAICSSYYSNCISSSPMPIVAHTVDNMQEKVLDLICLNHDAGQSYSFPVHKDSRVTQ